MLYYAVKYDQTEAPGLLPEDKSDLMHKDLNSITPLLFAITRADTDAIMFLLEYIADMY